MSLPDELMTRKANNLAVRDASMHPHATPKTFDAPDQRPVVPDNWYPASTGTYFADRLKSTAGSSSPVKGSGGGGLYGATGLAASGERSPPPHSNVSPSRSRMTPTDRQEEQDDSVLALTNHALQLFEASERDRLERRDARRDVELLKFTQKTKRRMELQLRSKQKLIGHGTEGMELEASPSGDENGRTNSSQQKDAGRNEAHRTFIESNFSRMERNQLHRQYCLDVTQERTLYRQSLEQGIGTFFAKLKLESFRTVGVEGADATNSRFPTKDGLYERSEENKAQTKQTEEEEAAMAAARAHMEALDAKLLEECRATKGKKAVRVREVPYSLNSPLLKSKQ